MIMKTTMIKVYYQSFHKSGSSTAIYLSTIITQLLMLTDFYTSIYR